MTDNDIVLLVAAKVMGYASCDDGKTWATRNYQVTHNVVFNPLVSDADACAVLDKMVTRSTRVSLTYYGMGSDSWQCQIGRFQEDDDFVEVNDDDRRRAICIAAIAAIGAWE